MIYLDILRRCCEDPDAHLAEASPWFFHHYHLGYELRSDYSPRPFDYDAIEQAIKADYKLPCYWPRSAHFFSFLIAAEGKAKALWKVHEYVSRFPAPPEPDLPCSCFSTDLHEFLSAKAVREKPGLYFGNDVSAEHIWTMLSGASWFERDSGAEERPACDLMERFQARIERIYPYSRGIPWHRILMIYGGVGYSYTDFFEHYDRMMGTKPDPFAEGVKIEP